MRDHTKLRAFELADEVVLLVYRYTASFPKEELCGLTSQMRETAVSVPSNIVEGCTRDRGTDYLKFLNFAFGSLRKLHYQISLSKRLGFLPGDMKEKVDPYLRPLYDALYDTLPAEQVERRIASGEIEIAPLAFMRGRTLGDAFVILDEAQNTTPMQMKMFLTRFGMNSRMVICGDPKQVDLPGEGMSGLADAVSRLQDVDSISINRFTSSDVVRHPLVGKIVDAYEGPHA